MFSLYRSPSTESSVRSLMMLLDAPLPVPISKVLSQIDAAPAPPCSPSVVTTDPLACASPLTERVLRSQCRNALRATPDVVAVTSPVTVRSHGTLAESDLPARISNSLITSPFSPQLPTSVYDYRISATAPRVTTRVANHPPFIVRVAPSCDFSPFAPSRASRSMSSQTTSTTVSPKPSTGASTKVTTRMASPPPSAPVRSWTCHPWPPRTFEPPLVQGRAAPPGCAPHFRCRGPPLPSTTDPRPI